MASKIGKKEWIILYVVMGFLDFVQFVVIEIILVWVFGLGALINEFLDPVIGVAFAGYLYIRGVSIGTYWKSYASIVGMEVLEEVTGGVAQLWVLDVWYISHNIKQVEGPLEARKEEEALLQNSVRRPANQNGVRQPETRTGTSNAANSSSSTGTSGNNNHITTYNVRPLNVDGVRIATNNQVTTTTKTDKPISRISDTDETLAA